MRWLVATPMVALAVAGCGNLDGPETTTRVSGTITIANINDVGVRFKERTSSCYGLGRYHGVEEGARVVVEDTTKNRVSSGKLGQGRLVYDSKDLTQGGISEAKPLSCTIGFVIEDVPPIGKAWSVHIGNYRFDLPPNRSSNLDLSLG